MYRNFIDYPRSSKKRVRMATGEDTPSQKNWYQRNETTILIVCGIALAGLLLLPDALIRKYVPFVK